MLSAGQAQALEVHGQASCCSRFGPEKNNIRYPLDKRGHVERTAALVNMKPLAPAGDRDLPPYMQPAQLN
jgi:hypothetical protein